VNEAKTAVSGTFGRKFLGFSFRLTFEGKVQCMVAESAIKAYKRRIRQITRRNSGRSLSELAEELRRYMPGLKAYFRLAQSPTTFGKLDGWLRHRLRALQLNHWKRGPTAYRALIAMGAKPKYAVNVAGHGGRWWHKSRYDLNQIMPIAYFDSLGVPRLL